MFPQPRPVYRPTQTIYLMFLRHKSMKAIVLAFISFDNELLVAFFCPIIEIETFID
jgi:hypothetical protein